MNSLILIRHAIAEERLDSSARGTADADRALTEEGKSKMKQAARGLARVVDRLDLILTSPYRRAVETAEIVQHEFSSAIEETALLSPGFEPDGWEHLLAGPKYEGTIACVGHEPDLGEMADWLLGGRALGLIRFKKGGACCIEFDGLPVAGRGCLRWLLPPKVLRTLCN